MATIGDVAAYILRRYGPMTTMKLQKLAFYSQAESLSRRDAPLFREDFQAWRGGPVCWELFARHRGMFIIRDGELSGAGDADVLDDVERGIVDAVCGQLAKMTGNELSERTHRESPWRDARGGIPATESCNAEISKESMREYYRSNPVVDAEVS